MKMSPSHAVSQYARHMSARTVAQQGHGSAAGGQQSLITIHARLRTITQTDRTDQKGNERNSVVGAPGELHRLPEPLPTQNNRHENDVSRRAR